MINSVVMPDDAMVCGEALLQDQLGLRIEGGERLVEQHDRGLDRQRARQRRALAHAAGQLVGIAAGEILQPAALQFAQRALATLGTADRARLETELDVAHDRTPRQQQILLQHEADARIGSLHRDLLQQDPSLARTVETGGEVEDRALAAARRSDDGDELAGIDTQAHALDGGQRRRAVGRDEALGDADELKHRCRFQHRRHPARR